VSITMKRKVAEELEKRLRSGDYKQGRGFLHILPGAAEGDEYCCLGVLCEMAVEEGVVKKSTTRGEHSTAYYGSSDTDEAAVTGWYNRVLPVAVVEWAGIKTQVDLDESWPALLDDNEGIARFARGMADSESYVQSVGDRTERHISLASMNDSGVPFEEIADFIRDKVVKV